LLGPAVRLFLWRQAQRAGGHAFSWRGGVLFALGQQAPPPRPPRPPTHHSQRASTCAGIATALRQRRRGLCCSASLRGALPAPWRAWHCIAVQGDIGARIVQAGMQKAHAQIGHFFACLAWQWQRALGLAYAARAPLACLA
jgi:hypothetical protein